MTDARQHRRPYRRNYAGTISSLALIAVFAGSLLACAPEPESTEGAVDKDGTGVNEETSWGDQETIETEFVTELPESFPTEAFALPDTATIMNTGERGYGSWFVVLHAQDATAAEVIWQAIIEDNAFTVQDLGESSDGGQHASLSSASLSVTAVTIPQSDSSVLLSYDLREAHLSE